MVAIFEAATRNSRSVSSSSRISLVPFGARERGGLVANSSLSGLEESISICCFILDLESGGGRD